MRADIIPLSLIMAVGLASCVAGDAESTPKPLTEQQGKKLSKALKDRVAGKPQNCLSGHRSASSTRISDDILLYRSGNTVYKNQLPYACHGLADNDDIMVVRVFGGNYCKGDMFQLADRFTGIEGPVCRFGEFVPYRKLSRKQKNSAENPES